MNIYAHRKEQITDVTVLVRLKVAEYQQCGQIPREPSRFARSRLESIDPNDNTAWYSSPERDNDLALTPTRYPEHLKQWLISNEAQIY